MKYTIGFLILAATFAFNAVNIVRGASERAELREQIKVLQQANEELQKKCGL
jgi:cell division protein FtsB